MIFHEQGATPARLGSDGQAAIHSGLGKYSHKQIGIFNGCLLLIVVLGWIDYITGYQLGFFIAYSAPVGLVAWHLGRWPAIFTALLSSIAWWLADSFDGEKYPSAFYWIWNNIIHFLSFVINAVAIAKIKTDLVELKRVRVELATVQRTLRAIAPLVPACLACNKPLVRPSSGERAELSRIIPLVPEVAGALCAECAGQHRRSPPARPSRPPASGHPVKKDKKDKNNDCYRGGLGYSSRASQEMNAAVG